MYTVTVCIVCATAVVGLASMAFLAAAAAVMISESLRYASVAIRSFWCDRILADPSHAKPLSGLALRRAREISASDQGY